MPILPGYAGRLGRLAFLGRSIGLLCATVALTIVLLLIAVPRGGGAAAGRAAIVVMAIVMPVYLYGAIGLQVRRLRDIGWSPLLVIGGMMALTVADLLVAHAVPALAAAHRVGTGSASIVQGIVSIALLFKAGRAGNDEPHDFGRGRRDASTPPVIRQRNLPGQATVPTSPTGFGRRLA